MRWLAICHWKTSIGLLEGVGSLRNRCPVGLVSGSQEVRCGKIPMPWLIPED